MRLIFRTAQIRPTGMQILHCLHHETDCRDQVEHTCNVIEMWSAAGSEWTLDHIPRYDIHLSSFMQFVGHSYIPLPTWLYRKFAVVNIKNSDNECFKWAVLAALHPQPHHPDCLAPYKNYMGIYDWSGLEFPVSTKRISVFEAKNVGIKVNVYSISREAEFPFRERISVLRRASDQSRKNMVVEFASVFRGWWGGRQVALLLDQRHIALLTQVHRKEECEFHMHQLLARICQRWEALVAFWGPRRT